MERPKITKTVREAYSLIARSGKSCCSGTSCCDGGAFALSLGYSENEPAVIPDGANLGLSCGNPTALSRPHKGEVVLDPGSGVGFDCFVAAPKVKPAGRVIGVEETK